jgi:integrase
MSGPALGYSGLRWGELAALTIPQVDQSARALTVDRKIVEVAGQLYLEAPKNRKRRRTIYPRRTHVGYPLADRLAARVEEARAEQQAGVNPLGLIFPSRKGTYWRSSNFNRRVLAPAYRKAAACFTVLTGTQRARCDGGAESRVPASGRSRN